MLESKTCMLRPSNQSRRGPLGCDCGGPLRESNFVDEVFKRETFIGRWPRSLPLKQTCGGEADESNIQCVGAAAAAVKAGLR